MWFVRFTNTHTNTSTRCDCHTAKRETTDNLIYWQNEDDKNIHGFNTYICSIFFLIIDIIVIVVMLQLVISRCGVLLCVFFVFLCAIYSFSWIIFCCLIRFKFGICANAKQKEGTNFVHISYSVLFLLSISISFVCT